MSEPITIRMYNVGFGDCFLLRFPTPDGQRSLLLDCGQHTSSKGAFDLDDVVAALLEDISDDSGNKHVDVVAISHRHQDHVRGFEDERWNDVHVDEVWMPWTENPDDPIARSLLERQSGGALALRDLAPATSEAHQVAMNSLTNEAAMTTLHTGFTGNARRRYFPEAADQEAADPPVFPMVQTPSIPGVSFRVLGPSRDEAIIRRMDPPELERYVARPRDQVATGGAPLPFERWRIDQRTFQDTQEYEHLDTRGLGDVVAVGREDPYLLAVALEQAVNNTSLMMMIQLGAAWLLFPGDSQWGTWDRVLQSEEGRDLLRRTTFYKVGHHGSHNATPRTFVETLLTNADAMVSVAPTGIPSWKDIPKAELLEALVAEGRCSMLVSSSDLPSAPGSISVELGGLVAQIEIDT
jgi:beta-lactamase superfamily II metal-dependent hydrolase